MRISTSMMHDTAVRSMVERQADLVRAQEQISTGRRILKPSDDPVASSQALSVKQAQSRTAQFAENVGNAQNDLGLTEGVLAQVTSLLQSVRDGVIAAGNPSFDDANRKSLAVDLRGRLEELFGLANATDGDGRHLFAGFRDQTPPFASTPSGIVYDGDTGRRELDVAGGRSMPVRENGAALFMAVRNGNGVFAATPAPTNTGTAVVGAHANVGATDADTYEIRFVVSAGVTTYDVVNVTTSTTVSTGNAYTAGSAIAVAGRQVTITGAPADTDVVSLAPSGTQSVFDSIAAIAQALSTPVTDATSRAELSNALNAGLQNVDRALEHVLTSRADVGARLRELEALASGHDDTGLRQSAELARLQDLDYAAAVSNFTRQQVALEASQKTYAQMSRLSLFDYL
jgi:flagellar hook-associated protein 3 FlgL